MTKHNKQTQINKYNYSNYNQNHINNDILLRAYLLADFFSFFKRMRTIQPNTRTY